MKTRYRLLAAAAIVIGGGVYLYHAAFSAEPANQYLTAPVTRGNLQETVLATGTLKPSKLVAVGSQATGRITALKVKLGDTVKQGDLIAEIDSTTQDNALRTAQASLGNVQAQRTEKLADLENAELTLKRQEAIVAKQAGSQADLQAAQAEVKVVNAQIAALDAQIVEAQVAVETAKADVGYTRIRAPMDGTVLAVVNQEGRTVNATQSAPTIVILGDLKTMTVRAEISEADITKVKPGQTVHFNLIGDRSKSYDAKLAAIEPAPESITSDSSVSTSTTTTSSSSSSSSSSAIYYIGVFDVPNPDGFFRTYMSAEVNIVLGSVDNVLTVPATALEGLGADGHYTVRVVQPNGSANAAAVTVGLNNRISAEIRSGLSEGDRVVIGEGSGTATTSKRGPGGPPPMGF
ncbi:MAG: efflux RND transporter periplasmic adaptor subunit [Neorhizobium sp.]|nr:efflux RND transporter periplasmic adaptor subunit [Neorhizobium sp.]